MTRYFLIVIAIVSSLISCSEEEVKKDEIVIPTKDELIAKNKLWHEQELADLDDYAKLHNWKVVVSGSGLRYVIYKNVDTTIARAKEGQIARVNYTISLLNDTVCYSSEGEPEEFLIGMDNVESGLHEGVTYMRKGEKAKIMLSSNLAFGLIGDLEKIPPQSSLIYDIELVDVLDKDTKRSVYDEKVVK